MEGMTAKAQISYRIRNDGAGGRPVVFVHGAAGNRLIWLSLTRRLAALAPQRPLYLLDLPGHGGSPLPGRDSIAGYVDALRTFFDELGISAADLVGHSMGGAVSLTFALDHPERVRRIAIVASGYSLPTAPTLIEAIRADFPYAMRMVRDIGFGANANPVEVNAVLEGLLACNPDTALKDFTACSVYNVKARVVDLAPPLAVFCGTKDLLTSEPRNRALAAVVPNARFHSFEDAGHMLPVERPDELAGMLAEFFADDG